MVFFDEGRSSGFVLELKTHKTILNYHPARPYMQFNGFKKQQYPLWTLLEFSDTALAI